jgi:hypothetical protein
MQQPNEFDVAKGMFGQWVADMRADAPHDVMVDGTFTCMFEFDLNNCLQSLMTDFEVKRAQEGKSIGEWFRDTGALMIMTRFIPANYSRQCLEPYYSQILNNRINHKLNKPKEETTND